MADKAFWGCAGFQRASCGMVSYVYTSIGRLSGSSRLTRPCEGGRSGSQAHGGIKWYGNGAHGCGFCEMVESLRGGEGRW